LVQENYREEEEEEEDDDNDNNNNTGERGRGLEREYGIPYLRAMYGSPLLIYHSVRKGNILHHDYATPPHIVQLSGPS
jgi:hypothetical protein